jgi:PAB1-binding protein PBP1
MRNPLTSTELNTRLTTTDNKVDTVTTNQAHRDRLLYKSITLDGEAGSYDIATATDGDILVEDVLLYMLTAGATFDSVSIQTNDTTPFVVMTSVEGAVANLTAQTTIKTANSQKSFYLASGQKLQYTIAGAKGSGSCYIVIKYKVISSGSLV